MTVLPHHERYKDSGVEWLPEVPRHWQLERARYIFRKLERPVRRNDGVVTCYRDGQVALRSRRREEGYTMAILEQGYQSVRKGELVVHGMDAFAGAIGVSEDDGKCTPEYSVLMPVRPDINNYYYAHLLRVMASRGYIHIICPSVRERAPRFRFPKLQDSRLPIPPKPEQDRIVDFLDRKTTEINELIGKKQRQIELLDEQKAILINRAVTRGLNPAASVKDSGIEWLPQIPEAWSAIRLRHLASMIQTGPFGSQLHSEEYVDGGTPVVNPSHMKGGNIVPDWRCAVSDRKVATLARHKLQPGDIVFARRGELGRCAVVTEIERGWLCGTGSLLFRPKPGMYDPAYLVQVLSDYRIAALLTLQSVGSTMDNLNTGMIADISIPLPPLDEQEKIMGSVFGIKSKFQVLGGKIESQIQALQTLRSTLIAHAVTGKIAVSGSGAV